MFSCTLGQVYQKNWRYQFKRMRTATYANCKPAKELYTRSLLWRFAGACIGYEKKGREKDFDGKGRSLFDGNIKLPGVSHMTG